MITVTKEFTFDAAHRLLGHEGACKNLHGHTYRAQVEVSAPELDSLGRVIDFKVLKRAIGGWIDETWDHAVIAAKSDLTLISFCQEERSKFAIINGAPTAEMMAQKLFSVADKLTRVRNEVSGLNRFAVESVRIYETPTSWAWVGK